MPKILIYTIAASFSLCSWAKRVDLQFAIEGKEPEILTALELDPKDVEEREIYLFDTPSLDLFKQRVQVRLRFQRDGVELAVKRWNLPAADFERLSHTFDGICERDVHGDLVVPACVAKKTVSGKLGRDLIEGKVQLLGALSRIQLELLMEGGSPARLTLDSSRPLGPIGSRVWEWSHRGSKFSLDFQSLPGAGGPLIEFSVKTNSFQPIAKAQEIRGQLLRRGLVLPNDQAGRRPVKLRTLLRCSDQLRFSVLGRTEKP